jgi:hypothetical protein
LLSFFLCSFLSQPRPPSNLLLLPQAFVSLRLDLLRPALSTLFECLRSEPGSEPRGSYQVLKEGSAFLKERVIDGDGKIINNNDEK